MKTHKTTTRKWHRRLTKSGMVPVREHPMDYWANVRSKSSVSGKSIGRVGGNMSWTDYVRASLGLVTPEGDDYTGFSDVSGMKFLAAIRGIPNSALEDAHNEAPTLGEIIRMIQDDPSIYVEGYVIGKRRGDERVTVDGIMIPYSKRSLIDRLRRSNRPDEDDDRTINGKKYVRLWWD
jgi:hypothetical protein